ncbi:MAG: hypothetical protein IJ515_03655 [Clostridia bacterium]|nr:hypothetical protein [Clostridia bacterium]
MKIRMIGTGYGECKIKRTVSKDYRGRGGVLIDDTILLDAPADIKDTADGLGLTDTLTGITDVLISHSHEGHFSSAAIDFIAKRRKVRVYASREVLVQLSDNPNIVKYEINAFSQFAVGKYSVTALPSNHSTENLSEECFNFLFIGDSSLLYALDGGWINGRAFNVLRHARLDAIIFDTALEAAAPSEKSLYHNGIYTLATVKAIFESCGMIHEKTRIILSHIPTDKRRSIHDELSPIAAKYGFTLSYDGYFARI